MKRFASLLAASAIAFATPLDAAAPEAVPSGSDRSNLHWIGQEIEIASALETLNRRAHVGLTVFRDVSVVDVVNTHALPHQSVITRDGRIVWVGDATNAPDTTGAFVIDGSGLYLSPGLTDMHVHTVSLAEQLLRLATGETAVRDMDGFPWMLETRRAIESGRLLAPTEYIAGTIITSYPLDGYSVVVKTEAEARDTVRKEAACGYDFIKVHNVLKLPLFDAVADEARRAGMDLVGHIPHDITIDHAVHSGGMRTLEHLKGFINDRNLIVSNEDYAKGIAGADVWLTPTFYTLNGYTRQANAAALLQQPQMQYVSLRARTEWKAVGMSDNDRQLKALFDVAVPAAMQRLLPLHPRWLAGTDAANYPLQVAGFALLDELTMMEAAGIPRAEVLRAATSEPAAAMRQSSVFGQVKRGMRADLVLLASDPTQNLNAYRDNRGVMVRGRWLDRTTLDASLAQLAAVEAEPDDQFPVTNGRVRALLRDASLLSADHIALDTMNLADASTSLRKLGYSAAAAELDSLTAATGPCVEITPHGGDD